MLPLTSVCISKTRKSTYLIMNLVCTKHDNKKTAKKKKKEKRISTLLMILI